MNRFLIVLLFAFLSPVAAHAQCAMPSGPPAEAGVIVFNTDHKVMQYCNGDKWIGLRGGSVGGADLPECSDSEIMQFSGGAWACNNGSGLDNLNASNIKSGSVPTARLGSGTADDTTFLRGDGTWVAPSGTNGIGMEQKWEDVKSSRTVNTSYRNTTGKPIMVSIAIHVNTDGYLQVSEDGTSWRDVAMLDNAGDMVGAIIIPPGHYYRAQVPSSYIMGSWAELR